MNMACFQLCLLWFIFVNILSKKRDHFQHLNVARARIQEGVASI